jgi:gas vesicle protein
MEDGDSGSFSLGFLFGAVAGVLIGFLIAPVSGNEVRSLIRDRAGEGLTRAREAAAGAAGAARKPAPREK